jgi:hypothetical protein
MNVPRAFHSAVLLPDDRVLATGGVVAGGVFSAADEIYDAVAKIWSTTKDAGPSRRISCGGYTESFLTPLPSGVILAAGGLAGDCASGAAGVVVQTDLFNPTSLRWSPTGKLESARALSTPALLADGRVLVAGGYTDSGSVQASAEFFDPASGGWSVLGALHTARAGHTATRLPNGAVLITGGSDGIGRTDSAEIYLPEIPYTAAVLAVPVGYGDREGGHFFGSPLSVATNSDGHIFIAYAPGGERRILEWVSAYGVGPPGGAPIREFGAGPDLRSHRQRGQRLDSRRVRKQDHQVRPRRTRPSPIW